jgi:hypothetical protein
MRWRVEITTEEEQIMKQKDLFKLALGLEDPWMVREVRFSPEEGKLDICLDFPRGATFRCPGCGEAERKAYDCEERTWRHLNFFQRGIPWPRGAATLPTPPLCSSPFCAYPECRRDT